ncbi:neurochondrin [Periophthalmus magnuspinnatus]|uniref:Neurochondrin n=1 Tax=Periophthalmus magnuspinnatus TaxID=409849 RepID=A0A3B4BKG3_9GOBI|nr:neurochondrin [Periophthalmus magnuspinnatus]
MMAESGEANGKDEQGGGKEGESAEDGGLSDAQREVLERCLHALKHAKNDSHTLAALLLITRLCPASQLDQSTLRRIFEAVGLNLPARLLVTAIRGSSESSGLAPNELLSLGTALLAALSTDPDMAYKPQLLTTIPILLQILSNGLNQQKQENGNQAGEAKGSLKSQNSESSLAKNEQNGDDTSTQNGQSTTQSYSKIDEAIAADCYQVLYSVCALPLGPEQLLNRGAVRALCLAIEQNQILSCEKGTPLLGCLLSGKTKEKAWNKNPNELFRLFTKLTKDFTQASEKDQLEMCTKLVQFLPPVGSNLENEKLKDVISQIWGVLRPMLQSKLTPKQIGPVLVLGACLLDVCGWEPVGPPKLCCLLVNRACVEVRMGLEEPPGQQLSPETQHTLTGCYRIMEAAMEKACVTGAAPSAQSSVSGLSLQQSRQVLGVLQEAFSAVVYHLQQVDQSRYGDPFIFATFRSLCSWLAEETSCLKEEVIALLPFLIGYCRSHMSNDGEQMGLSDWMDQMSVSGERVGWTGKEPLRYLLPALCHLSAEDIPRRELLSLDTPQLLVGFLSESWTSMKEQSPPQRDSSLETACSALLNFTITEPQRVRSDPCFRVLETLLSDTLPVLMHKPSLLVLAANICTLGLMLGRLRTKTDSVDSSHHRLLSYSLRFLSGTLTPGSASTPATVSPAWDHCWDEVAELWRLSVQALGSCVRTQPWIISLIRDEGWLKHVLTTLGQSTAPPDEDTQNALEEALCALADQCLLCKQEINAAMQSDKGGLSCLTSLKRLAASK